MRKVVIVSAVRTPVGKMGGALSTVPARNLGSLVIRESLSRGGVSPEIVDEVIFGCVLQAGLGQNIARQCSLDADIPQRVPAFTVNNVCGSGLKCVNLAAALIAAGEADVIVAGGTENMSQAPYVLKNARFGYRMNNGELVDSMVNDALWDAFNDYHMGITAENVAEKYGITRLQQDQFAAESQHKCQEALENGAFTAEIVPVTYSTRKGTVTVDHDEGPRANVTVESISGLCPAFKPDGTVTAANASGINDGAAALVLMSEEKAQELGITPLAEYVAGCSVGVDPATMGLGAGYAAEALFKKTGLTADDMTLIEANEAFAAQSIVSASIGGWDSAKNLKKLNVNGGAIALGHPVGASGARILVTLIHALSAHGGGKGIATLCVGGGMGVATMVDMVKR